LNAMVEAGLDYELKVINIFKGEQKSPEYLKVHPGGKVPALQIEDGRVLTENASILMYLHELAPEAGILPASDDAFTRAQYRSDLVWCSSTFHVAVRQVRMAMRFTDGDSSGVRAKGVEFTSDIFKQVDSRVSDGRWWYGDTWSIVDVYILWCVMTATSAEPSLLQANPNIQAHMQRVMDRPSFKEAMMISLGLEKEHQIEFPA
ncbi:MAG: glutathione S-transferase family protein, partial [Pseudomonadota bacterium]